MIVALAHSLGATHFWSVVTADPLERPRPKSIVEYVLPRNAGFLAKPVPPKHTWDEVSLDQALTICRKHPDLIFMPTTRNDPDPQYARIHDHAEIPEAVRAETETWLSTYQIGRHRLFLDPYDRSKVTIATLSVQTQCYGFPPQTFEWMRLIKASPSVQAIQTRIEAAIGPVKFGWTWKLAGEKPADFVP